MGNVNMTIQSPHPNPLPEGEGTGNFRLKFSPGLLVFRIIEYDENVGFSELFILSYPDAEKGKASLEKEERFSSDTIF